MHSWNDDSKPDKHNIPIKFSLHICGKSYIGHVVNYVNVPTANLCQWSKHFDNVIGNTLKFWEGWEEQSNDRILIEFN